MQGINVSCPAGDVCNGTPAKCTAGCSIAGAFVGSGTTANDGCEVCTPGTSTTAWTDVNGAASCAAGEVCNAGSCAAGCFIAGGYVSSGTTDNGGCEVCDPGASRTAWTDVDGPASCAAVDVCKAGSCAPGCFIASKYVASGATANSGCEVCDPGASTTAWTDVNGAGSCAAGKVCNAGSCTAGCSIAGSFVSSGATANSGCEVCTPSMSTTAWTDVYGDASCPTGETCNAGSCAPCVVGATWSMTVTSVTTSTPLCQGVMDCAGDCGDFDGTSTSPDPTTLDWNVSPGGTICDTFTGQVAADGQFTSSETDCSPAGDGTTFGGQVDVPRAPRLARTLMSSAAAPSRTRSRGRSELVAIWLTRTHRSVTLERGVSGRGAEADRTADGIEEVIVVHEHPRPVLMEKALAERTPT